MKGVAIMPPPTTLEVKANHKERLFDLMEMYTADNDEDRKKILNRQLARARSVMTTDEIAEVEKQIEAIDKDK